MKVDESWSLFGCEGWLELGRHCCRRQCNPGPARLSSGHKARLSPALHSLQYPFISHLTQPV
ncbi:hypothetical protein J6590_005019 [Homalodisca vitripennis]|nr:hypothetical protein J6590_005019 [Homalodisca vitripennis]